MRVSRVVVAVSFLFLFVSVAFGEADPKTKQMMEEVMKKVQKVESYRVDLRMETSMMNQEVVTEGEMSFKKPDKLHMVTVTSTMPGVKQEVFADADIVWTYMPQMRIVTRVDMSKVKGKGPLPGGMNDTADITKPFEGFSEENIRFIDQKVQDGREYYLFEAMPSAGSQGVQMAPHKIGFWIHAATGLPHRVIMYAKDGSVVMEQQYSNFRLNVPIEESEFEFTPPDGVQVMDMTEATMNMMQQMKEGQPVEPPSME
ncbi:MAG: hypothetical protein Kow0099_35450 [Candidatus Abyssubacteria bacterium]